MRCKQLPEARLVARRWLVLATLELEDQHSHHGWRNCGSRCHDLEFEREPGVQERDATGGSQRDRQEPKGKRELTRKSQPDRFFPSRFWTKQIREYEAEQREKGTPGYEKR